MKMSIPIQINFPGGGSTREFHLIWGPHPENFILILKINVLLILICKIRICRMNAILMFKMTMRFDLDFQDRDMTLS